MKSYIKIKSLSEIAPGVVELKNLTNAQWKEWILSYILEYFKQVNDENIQRIINEEMNKKRANVEKVIKDNMQEWFDTNRKFLWKGLQFNDKENQQKKAGLITNFEPKSKGKREGYYDVKVQHSEWDEYFPFECKNLGKFKSTKESRLINEYVFIQSKNDGGMHRYFIDKYSANQNFGGMIGFVIAEASDIQTKIVNKIHKTYDDNEVGKLTQEKIVHNSIFENTNTFDSIHTRKNPLTNQDEEFMIHHIIMDFVNTQE